MGVEPEQLRIYLLSDFRVHVGGQVVDVGAWRLRKGKSLVKLLALAQGHRLHREQVLDVLWPDLDRDAANNSLHQALHTARRALQPPGHPKGSYLQLLDDLLVLCPDEALWIDVEAFEALAAAARRERTPEAYRQAIELYSGDLLPEELYEDWAAQRREALRGTYIRLLIELAQIYEADAAYGEAIALLQRALLSEPTLEEAHAGLMRLYALSGRRPQALRQYATLRDSLQRDLEIAPGEVTRLLYEAIQAGSFPPEGPASDVAPLHRPAVIGPSSESSPPAAPVAPHTHQHLSHSTNLPTPLSSFIGRGQEKEEVKRLLGSSRLLTLTGPGGCGKTRLALEVAREAVGDYTGGVWLVELAHADAAQVQGALAAALGLIEASDRSLTALLINYIKPRQLLLVLDNCEHVIDTCARLAGDLLAACPMLRVLATSRESLHVPGEVTWLVPSLSLPDRNHVPPLGELEQYEAIRLFAERAREALPAFELTERNAAPAVEVCHRLDGIPLAIELAAARITALSVEQIAGRLDDCFRLLTGGSRSGVTRQQTLKTTLDWSFDLLAAPEQILFNRLSVFAGSFDLEGVEAICSGGEIAEAGVLDLLAQLVNKSLVMAREREGRMRYHLLEPVRQYGEALLAGMGETAAARDRHLRWYTEMAERSAPELWGASQLAHLDWLDLEQDNLQAALGWSTGAVPYPYRGHLQQTGLRALPGEQSEHAEEGSNEGLRLGAALWQFWVLRGHIVQGRRWLERLLASHPEPSELRAEALLGACALSTRMLDSSTAMVFAHERYAVHEALGNLEGMSDTSYLIGALVWLRGDYIAARAHFLHSRELARRIEGFPLSVASRRVDACATHALGVLAAYQGDYTMAEALMREALSILGELDSDRLVSRLFISFGWMPPPFAPHGAGHMMGEGTMLMFRDFRASVARAHLLANLGSIARMRLDTAQARLLLDESSALFRQINDNYGIEQVLRQLGNLAITEGDYARASELLQRSLEICTRIADGRGIGLSLHNLARLDLAQGNYNAARERLEEALAFLGDLKDGPGSALILQMLGYVALAEGEYERARSLLEELSTFYRRTESTFGGRQWGASTLVDLALVARLQGDHDAARAYLREGMDFCREEGIVPGVASALYQLGCVALAAGDLVEAQARFDESLARFKQLDDRLSMAIVYEAITLSQAHGDPLRAVRMAGAASALRETVPPALSQAARPDLDHALATLRSELSPEEFASAWNEGRASPK